VTRTLSLGYSPCPNDTFIFFALVHGRVKIPDCNVLERLEDVETLNRLALEQTLDLSKVSYHALGHLRSHYALLRSGGALGRGCGPLVVGKRPASMADLRGRAIAVPGRLTTANLLLQLYGEGYENLVFLPFDKIMPAVAAGAVDAGVIIHESRFTFRDHGLVQIVDLGQWWEEETGLPIPLGGIMARRDLGAELIGQVDEAVRQSLKYAFAHPREPQGYIQAHAQEMSGQVVESHIALYVNDFSLDLGEEGLKAVEVLLARAESQGLFPPCSLPLLLS